MLQEKICGCCKEKYTAAPRLYTYAVRKNIRVLQDNIRHPPKRPKWIIIAVLGVQKMAVRLAESKFWDHFSIKTPPLKRDFFLDQNFFETQVPSKSADHLMTK